MCVKARLLAKHINMLDVVKLDSSLDVRPIVCAARFDWRVPQKF